MATSIIRQNAFTTIIFIMCTSTSLRTVISDGDQGQNELPEVLYSNVVHIISDVQELEAANGALEKTQEKTQDADSSVADQLTPFVAEEGKTESEAIDVSVVTGTTRSVHQGSEDSETDRKEEQNEPEENDPASKTTPQDLPPRNDVIDADDLIPQIDSQKLHANEITKADDSVKQVDPENPSDGVSAKLEQEPSDGEHKSESIDQNPNSRIEDESSDAARETTAGNDESLSSDSNLKDVAPLKEEETVEVRETRRNEEVDPTSGKGGQTIDKESGENNFGIQNPSSNIHGHLSQKDVFDDVLSRERKESETPTGSVSRNQNSGTENAANDVRIPQTQVASDKDEHHPTADNVALVQYRSWEEATAVKDSSLEGKQDERTAAERRLDEADDHRNWKTSKLNAENQRGLNFGGFSFISESVLNDLISVKRRYVDSLWGRGTGGEILEASQGEHDDHLERGIHHDEP